MLPTTSIFFSLKSKILPNLNKYYRQILLCEVNIFLLNEVVFRVSKLAGFFLGYDKFFKYKSPSSDFLFQRYNQNKIRN